jgi:hypothetical protein
MNAGIQRTIFKLLVLIAGLQIAVMTAQEPDTTNILDLSDKFLIRIYTISKSNSLTIENELAGKALELLPNGQTNLGVGFNYKRIGLGVAFNTPISSESNRKYGKTKRLDIQGSMYGDKVGADGFFQLYKGYYNTNPGDFTEWSGDVQPQISNMRVLSVGLIGFYLFNSDTYSYRAAFVRDEVQRKSAGSFLLGVFGNYDESKTDNGFIPEEFPDNIRTTIDIREFTNLAIGVSAGYAHNFAIREKFIFGVAVIPGFGYQRVSILAIDGSPGKEDQPAAQLLTRVALGYEHRYFYLGITGSVNFRNIDFTPYDFRLATEQIRFIIGKRFDL